MKKTLFALLVAALILAGCDQTPVPEPASSPASTEKTEAQSKAPDNAQIPPTPPLFENFQGEPQISFFARVGETRPAQDDELFPFWLTYLEHMQRTCGVVTLEDEEEPQRFFRIRSLENIESVGFFAPIAVTPYTNYKVSVRIKADLPEKASSGIGIQEFNQFLWIADQFTEELNQKHLVNSQLGLSVSGALDWTSKSFTFTTGPQSQMIHLILFRDGPDDKSSVLFDDLIIETVGENKG